jgi:hypothetical protein
MRWIAALFILVVINPYAGIDYDKINVYSFEDDEPKVIVHKSDMEMEEEYEQFSLLLEEEIEKLDKSEN